MVVIPTRTPGTATCCATSGRVRNPVYGFERRSDGTFGCLGRFRVEKVSEERQPDRRSAMRRVYVFHLRCVPKQAERWGAPPIEKPSTDDRTPFPASASPVGVGPERAYPLGPPPPDWNWAEQMRRLLARIEQSGFVFEPWQIAAYVTALRTKPFVILAGISAPARPDCRSWSPGRAASAAR